MPETSKTVLRVIRGTVGSAGHAFEVGDTFVAEDVGADVAHLLRAKAVEVVSMEGVPEEEPLFTNAEFAEFEQQALGVVKAVGSAVFKLGGRPVTTLGEISATIGGVVDDYVMKHNSLAEQEASTRERSSEIASENVAAHAELVKALSLTDAKYDPSMSSASLASTLGAAVEQLVREKKAREVADAVKSAALGTPEGSGTPEISGTPEGSSDPDDGGAGDDGAGKDDDGDGAVSELEKLKTPDLKAMAAKAGIDGADNMSRKELIAALTKTA
jgi:hypothetical protein